MHFAVEVLHPKLVQTHKCSIDTNSRGEEQFKQGSLSQYVVSICLIELSDLTNKLK